MAKGKQTVQLIFDGYVKQGLFTALNGTNRALGKLSRNAANVSRAQTRAAGSGIMLGGSLVKAGIAAAAAYISIQQLSGAYHSIMEETNGAINAQTRLDTLMMNVKGTTMKDVAAVGALADKLKLVTTIDDDVTKAGASQLATYQLRTNSILKLLPALQDLAVGEWGLNVSEEQIIASANKLGKVFAGKTGALSKAGISFSKAQEKILKMGKESEKTATLIQVVQQNYGKLARKMALTPEGKVKQLKNAWADVKKLIGYSLIPIQQKAVSFLVSKLPAITGLIERMISSAHKAAPAFQPIVNVLRTVGQVLAKQNWGKIGAGILRVFKPILSFITGKLLPFIGKLIADIGGIFAKAWPVLQPALQQLGAAIGSLLTAIMPILVKVWAIVKPILAFVIGTALPLIIKAIAWIVKLIATLITKLMQANEWFVNIGKKVGKWISGGGILHLGGEQQKVADIAKRVGGGPVSAGRPYLVGERGPEWFLPGRSGGIIPNMAMAGAGGITLNASFTINAPGGDPPAVRKAVGDGLSDWTKNLRRHEREVDRRSFKD